MRIFSRRHISLYSDEELVLLISKKNEKAFEEIYRRYAKKMHYFFYIRFNSDKEIANDLLQELFVKLLSQSNSFDSEHKFSTWFYTMANNNCKNEYKKRTYNLNKISEEEQLNIVDESIVFDNPINSDFEISLEKALSRLKETHRTSFILKYKENLTISQIAEIMECSEGTVKSRLHYTVKNLANTLSKFKRKQHSR